MRPSQNLPLFPRIYSPFQQIYSTLPESTPPCQNIPPFLPIICDPHRTYPPPRIYPLFNNYVRPSHNLPSLTEYSLPLFNNYMRPSQNLPPPSRVYPLLITICDTPRIYPYISEYTPLFNNYMRPSQNLPLPPRIYPSF